MEEYFSYLDQSGVSKNYDWFALNIDLNFNKDSVSLEKILNNESEFGNSDDEIIFIHEYIHYLQNFNTPLGIMMLCQFTHGLFQLGASKIEEGLSFNLPLNLKHEEGGTIWNNGIDNIEVVRKILGSLDDTVEYVSKTQDSSYKISSNSIINFSVGRVVFELTTKTIREHMAHLGSMLFVNYTDEQIHKDYVSRKEFCSAVGIIDKQPSYWILFEYFHSKKYTSVAEGLILLCTECFCCTKPIDKFIRFILAIDKEEYSKAKSLQALVKIWRLTSGETKIRTYIQDETMKMVTDKIELCKKHSETHDFYKFNVSLFEKLKYNLENYDKLDVNLADPKKLREKKTWINIIKEFGTPIMRYKDKSPIITNQTDNIIEALTYFFGVVKTIGSLVSTTIERCPFHSDYKICKAAHKNDTTCLTEPYLVINTENNGEECIYQNSIILMGFDGRISI